MTSKQQNDERRIDQALHHKAFCGCDDRAWANSGCFSDVPMMQPAEDWNPSDGSAFGRLVSSMNGTGIVECRCFESENRTRPNLRLAEMNEAISILPRLQHPVMITLRSPIRLKERNQVEDQSPFVSDFGVQGQKRGSPKRNSERTCFVEYRKAQVLWYNCPGR